MMNNKITKKGNASTRVVKNSIVYAVGSLITNCCSLFVLPIITSAVSTDEYGAVTVLQSLRVTMTYVVTLAFIYPILRFVHNHENDSKKRFIGTIFTSTIITSVLFFGIGLIGRNTFSIVLLHDSQYQNYYDLFLCIMLFCGVFSIYQSYLQSQQKSKKYVFISVSYTLTYILICVLLLTVLHLPGYAILVSLLITNVLFAGFAIVDVFIIEKNRVTIDRGDFQQCISYSMPLLPNALSGSLVGFFSKYVLSISDSFSSTGIFGICMQFGNIMEVFNTSTNNAMRPWFNAKMDDGDGVDEIVSTIDVIHKGVAVVCCMIMLFSQEVVLVMTNVNYHPAWKAVPIMVAAYFIRFIYFNNTLPILYNVRASKFISVLSVGGCLINVMICALLSSPYGIYGCALAYLIQNILMAIAAIVLSNHYGQISLNNKRMLKTSMIALILSVVGIIPSYIWFPTSLNIINILCKCLILVVAASILLRGQMHILRNFFKSMLQKERKDKT